MVLVNSCVGIDEGLSRNENSWSSWTPGMLYSIVPGEMKRWRSLVPGSLELHRHSKPSP